MLVVTFNRSHARIIIDYMPQPLLLVHAAYIYMGAVLHAQPIRGESHIQRKANWEVPTISPPFYNKPHQSHVLFVEAAPGTISTSSWS